MKQPVNARKKQLDAISKKIAVFIVTETFRDEQEIQKDLGGIIKQLDAIAIKCIANDDAAATQAQP